MKSDTTLCYFDVWMVFCRLRDYVIFYRQRERVYCADVTSHVIVYRADVTSHVIVYCADVTSHVTVYRVEVTGIAMVYSAHVIGHF